MNEHEKKDKIRITGFTLFAIILLVFSTGSCLKVLANYEKVDAVVVESSYYSGKTTKGTDLTKFEYTYNGEQYCHIIDTGTSFLYSKGSHAILYCNSEDEKLLSDILILPVLSLVLLFVSFKM